MKRYDYVAASKKLLTPDITALLKNISELKSRQEQFVELYADELTTMTEIAKIQSVGAATRIEGINTTDKRLSRLLWGEAEPKNINERKCINYSNMLSTVHDSYNYIVPQLGYIKYFHAQLYLSLEMPKNAAYRDSNRVNPRMKRNCEALAEAYGNSEYDKLLPVHLFTFNFARLKPRPFGEGSECIVMLFYILLLYRAGYNISKYISVEKQIEENKDIYAGFFREGDAAKFVHYALAELQRAYMEFEEYISSFQSPKYTKYEKVKSIIDKSIDGISKNEILELCPDIERKNLEKILTKFVKEKYIVKIGAGRSTVYVRADRP